MKKASTDRAPEALDDELRPEYRFDYSRSRPNRFAGQPVTVELDAEVAAAFPTSEAVNAALRALLGAPPTGRVGESRRRRANNEMQRPAPRQRPVRRR